MCSEIPPVRKYPQLPYKLPLPTLRWLSHPVSQTGPLLVIGPTVPAQQKSSFFAITFERNTFGEIHESKTF